MTKEEKKKIDEIDEKINVMLEVLTHQTTILANMQDRMNDTNKILRELPESTLDSQELLNVQAMLSNRIVQLFKSRI